MAQRSCRARNPNIKYSISESELEESELELISTKTTTPLKPSTSNNRWCFSRRKGDHWTDGHALIYSEFLRMNVRLWDDCIPMTKLSIRNLPPYYVRLRDDQVGHLIKWMSDQAVFGYKSYCKYWSLDLTVTGEVSPLRESWGKPYLGAGPRDRLQGGEELPRYDDLGLPSTRTSSGRIMRENNDGSEEKLDNEVELKRKRNDSEGNEQGRDKKSRTTVGTSIVMEDLIDKIDQLIDEIYQKNKQIADIGGRNANLEAKIIEFEAKIIDLEASIADLKDETHQLGVKESKKETEIIGLKASCASMRTNLLAALGEKERFLAKNVQLNREMEKLATDLEALKKQEISQEAATRALKSLKEQFAKARDIVDEAQKGLQEIS